MMMFSTILLSSFISMFAAFPSSTTYQLNNYSIGSGGTNKSASATYNLNGSIGEQTNGTASSTNDTAGTNSIKAGQLNTPPAPSLSNGSNTYYNKLLMIINDSVDPSDSTYSVAISTNNFTTTSYVSAIGTITSTPVYQTYSAWGGSSGSFITGLTNSTSYEVKVDAKEGQFSDTNYGAYASATTVAPSISFSITPNTLSLGSLLPGTVASSSNISFGFSTDAVSGGAIYLSGANNGLYSANQSHTIAAYSGNLSSATEGFGAQVSSVGQTSGGPFAIISPFNGTGNTVGAETTAPAQMVNTTAPITGGTATANLKAIVSSKTPSSSDYSETLTFIAAANY